jgi:hypothetical protein
MPISLQQGLGRWIVPCWCGPVGCAGRCAKGSLSLLLAHCTAGPASSGKGKPNHYKRRGLYAQQLEQVLQHYPLAQLLVLRSEDFFAQPADSYSAVQRFLGLDLQPLPPLSAPENVGRARAEIPAAVREHLQEYYREPNQRLQALLPDFPAW